MLRYIIRKGKEKMKEMKRKKKFFFWIYTLYIF
jgi:hypothetical protein